MTPTAEQVAPHMARFLDMLDEAFRRFGAPDGLPEPFRRAVTATPRHSFVHRFRISGGPLRTRDAEADLADIYSDAVMTHVDAAGEKLPSTNSQPSFVLWLLHLLDLQPGHHVLEIGSGSGWLAAIMARLVGESGHVTGIEVIPDLAVQSRADLAGLGIGNVAVLATDGIEGHAAGAPFDRAMITAGVWDLPVALFDQVIDGGCVLVPVELRGGGCHVAVLRRGPAGFVAERAVPGWFVPLLGPTQQRPLVRYALSDLPFWPEVGGIAPRSVPLPLATGPEAQAGSAVGAFRAFLGRTVPGFVIFGEGEAPEQRAWLPAEPFGIVDVARRSVALWHAGALLGYGGPSALRAMADAYACWAAHGLPGLSGLELTVLRHDPALAAAPLAWIEERGKTVLVWRFAPNATAWRIDILHEE